MLIFSSCGKVLKFKNDGDTGNLIDEENGRYYIYCKGYLRAAAINTELYAICPKEKGSSEVRLYEIPGLDPAKWLSEDISTGVPFLFREQSEEEPTLAEFETDIIHVTLAEEIIIELWVIDEKEKIDAIVDDFINGEQIKLPEFISDNSTLIFESEKYKGIYYIIEYLVDDKGNNYLYDRWTGRCVLCSVRLTGGGGAGNDNSVKETDEIKGAREG